jgi:hypothetical protein
LDCSDQAIELPLIPGAKVTRPDGTVVEALQIPSFTEANHLVSFENVPPESWDRSEIPAGACVFRIHGLHASCFVEQNYGMIFVGSCRQISDGSFPAISPGGYYEQGCKTIAPGCTRPTWGSSDGYWWYLNSRQDAIDVVICAEQCGGSYNAGGNACLMLRGSQ